MSIEHGTRFQKFNWLSQHEGNLFHRSYCISIIFVLNSETFYPLKVHSSWNMSRLYKVDTIIFIWEKYLSRDTETFLFIFCEEIMYNITCLYKYGIKWANLHWHIISLELSLEILWAKLWSITSKWPPPNLFTCVHIILEMKFISLFCWKK